MQNIRIIKYNNKNKINPMCSNGISYITSPEHLKFCISSFLSFKKYNNIKVELIIICDNPDEIDFEYFKTISDPVTIIDVSGEQFKNINDYWPNITMKRLLLLTKFFSNYEKIFSLESDILIVNSIYELFDGYSDKFMYACYDAIPQNTTIQNNILKNDRVALKINEEYKNILNLNWTFKEYIKNYVGVNDIAKYFNIGVLLINYKKYKEYHILKNKNEISKFLIIDQDYMNKNFISDVGVLPYSYGYNPSLEVKYFSNQHDYFFTEQKSIIHFNGSIYKPWSYKSLYYSKNKKDFLKYQKEWSRIYKKNNKVNFLFVKSKLYLIYRALNKIVKG